MSNYNDRPLRNLLNESTPAAPATSKEVQERMHSLEPWKEQEESQRQGRGPTQGFTAPVIKSTGLEVFVPISPNEITHAGDQEVHYEVRNLSGGGPVLPIYTSEAMLSTALGGEQRFAQIDIIDLLRQIEGRVPLVVNPVLAEHVNSVNFQAAQDRGDEE